jgi:L-threonylcarbamoyladenylate synthase
MAPDMMASVSRTPRPLLGRLDRRTAVAAASILAAGGVVVLPTDTLYGLHCAASCRAAVARIRALKGRGGTSGFILLASDMAMAELAVARWPGSSKDLLASAWPAPLTAVLPASPGIARTVAPGGAVAVRVPASESLRFLIAAVGEPIVSTSVNVSGRPPMTRIAWIREVFPGLDAYLSGSGRPSASPSTVVDFRRATPRLIRAGRYPWAVA